MDEIRCSGVCEKMFIPIKKTSHTCAQCIQFFKINCCVELCKEKRTIENSFCWRHQDSHSDTNRKMCTNSNGGSCRERLLLSDANKTCNTCREKDRNSTNKRNRIRKETYPPYDEQNNKLCVRCFKYFNVEQFIGEKGDVIGCKACRDKDKKCDATRDHEHRLEVARKNDKSDANILRKKEWETKNIDKRKGYFQKSRAKSIVTDYKGYLERNAIMADKWRKNNPEKVAEYYARKKNDVTLRYNVYLISAREKNIAFELSQEQLTDIILLPCAYCGIIQDKGFNGIDRVDSAKNYTIDNCVSCCEMCNMLKGSLSVNTFIKRIEHILAYRGITGNTLYPNMFINHAGCSYISCE